MSSQPGSTTGTFTLNREPLETRLRQAAVRNVRELTPVYRRVEFAGPELTGFASPGADDHLRIFFPAEGERLPELGDQGLPPGIESREYTPVAWDGGESLTIDFVVHGDGIGSRWAETAKAGDEVFIGGPRRSLVIDGTPDWWLLAGDLTALPAIRRFAAAVPVGTPVDAVLLSDDPVDEQDVTSPGEFTLTWVHPVAGSTPGDPGPLLAALARLPRREGDGFAFVAAEQAVVQPARALLAERGVDLERAVVKGYWKRTEPVQ